MKCLLSFLAPLASASNDSEPILVMSWSWILSRLVHRRHCLQLDQLLRCFVHDHLQGLNFAWRMLDELVGSMKQNILHKDSEEAFKNLARILLLFFVFGLGERREKRKERKNVPQFSFRPPQMKAVQVEMTKQLALVGDGPHPLKLRLVLLQEIPCGETRKRRKSDWLSGRECMRKKITSLEKQIGRRAIPPSSIFLQYF